MSYNCRYIRLSQVSSARMRYLPLLFITINSYSLLNMLLQESQHFICSDSISAFSGEKDRHYHHTPHEAPLTMTIPLIFLAFGSVVSGFIPFSELVTSDGKPFETET